jgi:hydrogenase expression/formation protein HypE
MGDHGIAVLSARGELGFEAEVQSDVAPLNHLIAAVLAANPQVHVLRDPTRGGVATTLNEIARDTRLGIDLWQKNIPVSEAVAGACELLGLDPLYVANEGIFMAFVAADVADACLEQLRSLEYGAQAAIIGEVVEAHPRQVVLTSKIGGKRVVNMLIGEQLPRIC